jgi:hypothetical protein
METIMTNAEFNALVKSIKLTPTNFESQLMATESTLNVDEVLAQLCTYWKVAKPILKLAKIITPPKVDKAIDEILNIVDRLCSNPDGDEKNALLDKFTMVWGTVKPILETAKDLTGPKADKVIDEIIKIGDLLAKS